MIILYHHQPLRIYCLSSTYFVKPNSMEPGGKCTEVGYFKILCQISLDFRFDESTLY